MVASGALRTKFDVLPASIWLIGVNKLVSTTTGRCNKQKQLLLLLWPWHLNSVHKQKGESNLLLHAIGYIITHNSTSQGCEAGVVRNRRFWVESDS